MSKWSKTGTRPLPQMVTLKNPTTGNASESSEETAQILAEKFFPCAREADLSDLGERPDRHRPWADPTQDVEGPNVSAERLTSIIRNIPNGKAPGPDEIPEHRLPLRIYGW